MRPTSATEQYRIQQARAAATEAEALQLWRRMGGNWESAWGRILPRIVELVTVAQYDAAVSARQYLPNVLEETTQQIDGAYIIAAEAFAGTASDGRPLDSLLYQAVVHAGQAYNAGSTWTQALKIGAQFLGMAVTAQVQDAGRAATGVGIASNRFVHGYVRFLNPPSCQRCAVLAGREYRYSTGFLRHPRCDCIMVPAQSAPWAEAEGLVWDATENLDLIKDLTASQRAAIEAGADISQVVNATRGMSVGGLTTLEGTSARGVFGRSQVGGARGVRLTPERIYQLARTDSEVVAMLEKYGYLNPARRASSRAAATARDAARAAGAGVPPVKPPRRARGAGDGPEGRYADTWPETSTLHPDLEPTSVPEPEPTAAALQVAQRVVTDAKAHQPGVRSEVDDMVRLVGGRRRRPEFEFKTVRSLARKLDTIAAETGDLEGAVREVRDVLRYTVTVPHAGYSQAGDEIVAAFAARGYGVRDRELWRPTYYGRNIQLQAPDGQWFELQIHTEASLGAAESTHLLYEEWRHPVTSLARKIDIAAALRDFLTRYVAVPPGVRFEA